MAVQTVRIRIKNETARAELEKLIIGIPNCRIETDDQAPVTFLYSS